MEGAFSSERFGMGGGGGGIVVHKLVMSIEMSIAFCGNFVFSVRLM